MSDQRPQAQLPAPLDLSGWRKIPNLLLVAGGLLALVIALWMMRALPDEAHLNVRATILLVALWFGIFSVPTFLFLRERGVARQVEPGTYVREGFRRVGETFRHLRRYREAAKVLLARLIYNDGLVTIFALAGAHWSSHATEISLPSDVTRSASMGASWKLRFSNRSGAISRGAAGSGRSCPAAASRPCVPWPSDR